MGVALLPLIDEKVFKAHRFLYHSTLGLRVSNKKKKKKKKVPTPPREAIDEQVPLDHTPWPSVWGRRGRRARNLLSLSRLSPLPREARQETV